MATKFEEGREEEDPLRYQGSSCKKFDELVEHKKSKSYPCCPEKVRISKQAARDIVGREISGEVVETSSDDENEEEEDQA